MPIIFCQEMKEFLKSNDIKTEPQKKEYHKLRDQNDYDLVICQIRIIFDLMDQMNYVRQNIRRIGQKKIENRKNKNEKQEFDRI